MNSRTMIATMGTAVTTTSAIPVGDWNFVAVEVATFAAAFTGANVALNFKVSNDLTGTYRPLQQFINSGSTMVAANIAVAAGVGNYVVNIPNAGNFNYLKIDTDIATTQAVGFRINVAN
jgi:hypothetical protein